ncbi:Subtilisin BL [Stieleria bergensis]|uniref:Subtilisin BL n=1 Tax=Stieleria bergensis TaxID=2528025 RepID=A0A517SRS1_9BACT|nr:Subtilisin BL [Planctomycetes bacterium SV_7m_r]
MLRALRIETMEQRRLLAADTLELTSLTEPRLVDDSSFLLSQPTLAAEASFQAAEHVDVGEVEKKIRIRGHVEPHDSVDVYQFNLERDAKLRLRLHRMQRNLDLVLTDTDGNVIAESHNSRRKREFIRLNVEAGSYLAWVVSTTPRSSRYKLEIFAKLSKAPSNDVPPADVPLADVPPADVPPADVPPADVPPADVPPADVPPADVPPADVPPADDPPADVPPADDPSPSPLAEVGPYGGADDWNLNQIGAPSAWAAGYTGEGVLVAVLDTGVDLDHPDLVDNIFVNTGEIAGNGIDDDGNGFTDDVHGFDFADNDPNPADLNGHGSHVAGTIAAMRNGVGPTGVAYDATILPVKILGQDGTGTAFGMAAGIHYSVSMGAQIINISVGGGFNSTIQSAISYAQSQGVLIVASAGNSYAAVPDYPAQYSRMFDNVISVGAYDSSVTMADFSNQVGGSGAVQVDAPGVNIYSTLTLDQLGYATGTSMASPHVTGLAALALSANPNLTGQQLRELIVAGVNGVATGSDSLGNASALQTVAYAAAGYIPSEQVAMTESTALATDGGVTASSVDEFHTRRRGRGFAAVERAAEKHFSKLENWLDRAVGRNASASHHALHDDVFGELQSLTEAERFAGTDDGLGAIVDQLVDAKRRLR